MGRNRNELAELKRTIRASGGDCMFVVADLSKAASIARAVGEAERRMERIDVLINAAGVQGPIGRFENVDPDAWARTIHVNLIGSAYLLRWVLPGMISRKFGRIVMFSGGGAVSPRPRFSAYAASKAGVVRLAETLAAEVQPFGITINSVAPGAINTRMLDEVITAGEGAGSEFEAAVERRQNGGDDLRRTCDLVLFLAVDAARGLTGKLVSAQHDAWETWEGRGSELNKTDLLTLRRVNSEAPHV